MGLIAIYHQPPRPHKSASIIAASRGQMKNLSVFVVLVGSLAIGQTAPKRDTTAIARKNALFQEAQYLLALATADRFLGAWMNDEPDLAEAMLAQPRDTPERDIETLLIRPCPCAFELRHGKRIRAGTYEFPVVLFGPPAGNSRISVKLSSIIVSRTAGDEWTVEKLPE